MPFAKINILLENSEPSRMFERRIKLPVPRDLQTEEYLADCLTFELQKELALIRYYDELPDVEDFLRPVSQTFLPEDLLTGKYDDRLNTRWMWFEIGNNLLRIKAMLAEARAYKELEPMHRENPEENRLLYIIHLRKMERFDLAAFLLAKTEDLVLRLLFENLGASIVLVDRTDADWERTLTWARVKKGLEGRSENPHLVALADAEYHEITNILAAFRGPDFVKALIRYRHQIGHRLNRSVDYPELYTYLQDRSWKPILDPHGRQLGKSRGIAAGPGQADYSFLLIYENAAKTLAHFVSLLRRLQHMPRFAPEAIRDDARGLQGLGGLSSPE